MSWDVSFLHDGQRSLPLLCRILCHCCVLETGTYIPTPPIAIVTSNQMPLWNTIIGCSRQQDGGKVLEVWPLLYVETPMVQGQVPGTLHTGVVV